jgi:dihydrodipicolinate synthase/N-acetylneuraminate lyase
MYESQTLEDRVASSSISRREFLAAAAAGSTLSSRVAGAAPASRLQGVFPIMQTPFTDAGALDLATLTREAQFLHRIGVQGPDVDGAVKYARHAETIGPDAIIAIPLDGGQYDARQVEYYTAIGKACRRPLIVQAVGQMSVDLILRMAKQIPTLRYVKDEAGVTLARLTEYRKREQILDGVFTGKHGPTFLDDLARGAVGNMPAAGFADLYVAAWQAWTAGKRDDAMEAFGRALLLIMDAQAYGVPGQKYILQLRGVFPNSKCPADAGAATVFDDEAREATGRAVAYAKRWFKV